MKKREISPAERKYTRREILKYGARVGTSSAFYGTIGGVAGRLYREARDFIYSGLNKVGNKLVEIDDKTDSLPNYNPVKIAKGVEDARTSFWRKALGISKEEQAENRKALRIKHPKSYQPPEKKEEKPISRRGFFSKAIRLFDEYPTASAAIAGATYGAGKSSIEGYSNYKTKKQLAQQRGKIEYLESEVEKLKQNRLEKKLNDNDKSPLMIFFGIIGIGITFALFSKILTGNAVSVPGSTGLNLSAIGIFLISIILILIGLKK